MKTTMYQTLLNSFIISVFILSWNTIRFVDNGLNLHARTAVSDGSRMLSEFHNEPVKLSLVILTYKKRKQLRQLLQSIVLQQTKFRYEIVIADNGCLPGLFNEIQNILMSNGSIETGNHKSYYQNFKYLQLCDNPGYSVGNNRAFEITDASSSYILFLNDDLVLKDSYFLQSMINIYDQHSDTVGAVGCMLLNEQGTKVLEAGSIVWSDGSTLGYGRNRVDIDADDLQYARPVDYVSGACLTIRKQLFQDIGGFDQGSFAAYYEDTDLQMKIQHKYNKQVWLQPLAVALHTEHATFGKDSLKLMIDSHNVFKQKWDRVLSEKHIYPGPLTLDPTMQAFRASDTRGRMLSNEKPNILYLDEAIPFKGNGNVRSFNNVMALNELGLRVTVFTFNTDTLYCFGIECGKRRLQQAGIEVQSNKTFPLEEFLKDRQFYYNVIIISGFTALKLATETLNHADIFREAAIIYDTPYVHFHRIEKITSKAREFASSNAVPPGIKLFLESMGSNKQFVTDRELEISFFDAANAVTAASEVETEVILDLLPATKSNTTTTQSKVITVGHVFAGSSTTTHPSFDERNGILFVGSFLKEKMLDNGDALWYFLNEIYPLILKELQIPLTVAGHEIPHSLYSFVTNNLIYNGLVKFVESPTELDSLYDHARVFVVPHLITSGVPYKVGEALAAGVPTVVSFETAKNFGSFIDNSACVGSSAISFKDCVVSIHNDSEVWSDYHLNGLSLSRKAYDRIDLKKSWLLAIETAFQSKLRSGSRTTHYDGLPTVGRYSNWCQRLDQNYTSRYDSVNVAIRNGTFLNGLDHFYKTNPSEGYIYNVEDERQYVYRHKDVQRLIQENVYKSGWEHFQKVGMHMVDYIYSPNDEATYRSEYVDVDAVLKEGVFPNAWNHFVQFGMNENRVYGCW